MFAIVEQRPHQVLITPRSLRLQSSGQLLDEDYVNIKGELKENIPALKRYDLEEYLCSRVSEIRRTGITQCGVFHLWERDEDEA